jgi:hypothetical protein
MTVTVLAILDTDFQPEVSLAKVMNDRLAQKALELKNTHLKALEMAGSNSEDVVVYISYNPKYAIKWRIVNDVPADVEEYVATKCAKLGYIKWKTNSVNVFGGSNK